MAKSIRTKLTAIIFALLLIGVGFAAGQYYLNRTYQRQVEAAYRRALGELATHFQGLAAEMGKARLAVSVKQRGLIGSNLRSLIYAAQSNLGELPLGEINLEGVCRLLDEVYEQTYHYVQGEADPALLEELYGQVRYVNAELDSLLLQKQLEFPWVSWQEYFSAAVAVPEVLQAFTLINDGLGELQAPLEQAAPFSRGEITGESISPEQAVQAARDFCRQEGLNFQLTSESKGTIPAYTVEAKDEKGRLVVEVSQKGGMVLWMMDSEEVAESRLTREEMVERGRQFLEERGFPPLHITDVQLLQNRATLTFVPLREGILRYGESVKVQVSAADGSILGFWGIPYYAAQSRLEGAREQLQEWDVQDMLRPGLEILDEKLVLLPTSGQEEVLTKRLGVRYQDEYFLIYLNAATGEEEQIVQVSSPEYF